MSSDSCVFYCTSCIFVETCIQILDLTFVYVPWHIWYIYEILDLSIFLCTCLKCMFQLSYDVSVVVFSSCMCRCSCVLILISHMYGKDLNVFVKICDTWIDRMWCFRLTPCDGRIAKKCSGRLRRWKKIWRSERRKQLADTSVKKDEGRALPTCRNVQLDNNDMNLKCKLICKVVYQQETHNI